jgi:hypothetical protein
MQNSRKKLFGNSVYLRVEYRFTFSLNLWNAPLDTQGRAGSVGVYSVWRIIVAATGSISWVPCLAHSHVILSFSCCLFLHLIPCLLLRIFSPFHPICISVFHSKLRFSLFYLNSASAWLSFHARSVKNVSFRLTWVGEFASARMSQNTELQRPTFTVFPFGRSRVRISKFATALSCHITIS